MCRTQPKGHQTVELQSQKNTVEADVFQNVFFCVRRKIEIHRREESIVTMCVVDCKNSQCFLSCFALQVSKHF